MLFEAGFLFLVILRLQTSKHLPLVVYSIIVGCVLMLNIIFGFHDKPTTCNYISALESLHFFFFLKKTSLGISETFCQR